MRRAKASGLAVTCDTAPPYFALNELAVGDYRTFAKLSPPLRSEEDRQAVVAGIADGTIDCIASDHFPPDPRSEEHTSELQSLMRISYAVFCLKKKPKYITHGYAPTATPI